jgi:hypothetical protein
MEIPTYYAEENTHILKDFAVPIFSLAFVDDLLAEETPIVRNFFSSPVAANH